MSLINRAPWTALVDDDGTNTTGTPWTKDKIKTVLLDPMDAAYAVPNGETVITSTTTGTQTAWAPSLNGHTLIEWSGPADLTLHGMAGGVRGQRVTLFNGVASTIYVNHNSTSAAVGNRFYNTVTQGPTPIGKQGYATWIYEGGNLWLLVAHDQGAWINVPFSAANFQGYGTMSWTVASGAVACNRIRVSGHMATWAVSVLTSGGTSTLGGTVTNICRLVIPNGWLTIGSIQQYFAFGRGTTAGTPTGIAGGVNLFDTSHVELTQNSVANYAAGSLDMVGTSVFEIQ